MAFDLTRALIQLPLKSFNAEAQDTIKRQLQLATDDHWTCCLEILDLHRLTPLVAYALEQYGLMGNVPTPYQSRLKEAYQSTNRINATLLLTLSVILKTLQSHGLHPIVWKGAALADSFYPDPGTRQMGDLDFAIARDEMEAAAKAFQSLGFQPQEAMETEDAIYFKNAMGVLCDVHHRVRLFEGKENMGLTVNLAPQKLGTDSLTILEPNAMVVHLVVHMDGHFHETGPILQWIIDVAFVLRKWRDELSLERLQALMPDQRSLILLFRIVRFLETEFEESMPAWLSDKASAYKPLELTKLIKQRQMALWQLFNISGWVKLALCRLGLRSTKDLRYPDLIDLLSFSRSLLVQQRW